MKILNKRLKTNQGNNLLVVIVDHSKEDLGLEISDEDSTQFQIIVQIAKEYAH